MFNKKLRLLRKQFGFTQEQLAELLSVSRQAITKWESGAGLPDMENLIAISRIFNKTVDNLLNIEDDSQIETIEISINNYKEFNKICEHEKVVRHFYPKPYEIYLLLREDKLNKFEKIADFLLGNFYSAVKYSRDISPYYLVKNNEITLLLSFDKEKLLVTKLDNNINIKKFELGECRFKNLKKVNI